MHSLAWITSCRQASCGLGRILVAGYLLDAPPGEVTAEALHDVAPELRTLFAWGRMVPLGEPRPHLVRTYLLPSAEVLQQYRAITGKVVYVARHPRTLLSDMIRGTRAKLDERMDERTEWALKAIAAPDTVPASDEGSGNWQLHAREWTLPERIRAHFPDLEDVCVIRYEDLRDDPGGTLHQIIDFLGVSGEVDGDRIQRTLRDWTPENMRAAGFGDLPPGMRAWRALPPRPDRPKLGHPSLAGVEEQLEAAYRERLRQDAEFAGLIKQFGYEH